MNTALAALIISQVALPAPQFDHPAPNMVVRHMELIELNERCKVHMPEVEDFLAACGMSGRDRNGKWYCLVNLPFPHIVGWRAYERLWLHERGGCNMMASK